MVSIFAYFGRDVSDMAEKKRSDKVIKKENSVVEKKARKNKIDKDDRQLSFDTPSDKMIHQILPFVFVVLAILLEVCFVLAHLTGDAYVGIAGVFLKNAFLGLFVTLVETIT